MAAVTQDGVIFG